MKMYSHQQKGMEAQTQQTTWHRMVSIYLLIYIFFSCFAWLKLQISIFLSNVRMMTITLAHQAIETEKNTNSIKFKLKSFSN